MHSYNNNKVHPASIKSSLFSSIKLQKQRYKNEGVYSE